MKDQVTDALRYDQETGHLHWIIDAGPKRAGSVAGSVTAIGYIAIRFRGEALYTHRVAVFLMTGIWPENVDHIDGNRTNNRWENLRVCSGAENRRNVGIRKSNTSGFKGVTEGRKGKWRATITYDNKSIYIGEFKTPELAAAAYDQKAIELHGEFAKTNKCIGSIS